MPKDRLPHGGKRGLADVASLALHEVAQLTLERHRRDEPAAVALEGARLAFAVGITVGIGVDDIDDEHSRASVEWCAHPCSSIS